MNEISNQELLEIYDILKKFVKSLESAREEVSE